MSLTPGTRLGVYEITAPLGEGGMGQDFRARDTKLDRDVAIKILPDAFAHDADRLARFTREAKTLASLNHSNIAAIYGLEESEGMTALVMELVEGDDLSQRIARGAIPIDEALPIARQIAEALEAAHEQGIIHRDLKPANIKVRADGTVKVLDFGLAKAMDQASGSGLQASARDVTNSPTITSPAMTQAGMILGTAAYMAPEQAKGRPADKRCDVWAFGCVLYEMLTGARVFAGEDVSDTLAFILTREPNWAALPANTPTGIRRLLRRCLERDRKRRVADISTAAFIIDEGEMTEPGSVTPALHDRRPLWLRTVPVVGVTLLAAAAVGVAWNLRRPQAPTALARFSFPVPEGQVLTANGARAVAISPDGTNVVYAADRQLYVRNIAELEARAIQGTQGAEEPFFSPDGKWVAFYASNDRKLKKIAITGGTPVTVCDAGTLFGASWAPDDSIFFGQGQKGILRVSANGGTPDVVAKGTSGEFAQGPRMLPGGDALLFTLAQSRNNTSWDRGQIVVESLKSGERKVLVEGGGDAAYVPTGHIVYAVGPTLLAVAFDTNALEITGGPVPVIEDVRRVATGTTGAAQYSISNTGSIAYLPGGGNASEVTLALVDHAGSRTPLNIDPAMYSHPRISSNGELLAVQKDDGREQNVWIYGLKGAAPIRRLTFGGAVNNRPTWTPDGQRIVFRSDREGDGGLFWQRATAPDRQSASLWPKRPRRCNPKPGRRMARR